MYHYKDNTGINEKKVNSESPIIDCGIGCNLDVSCNGFFYAENTCSTFEVNIKSANNGIKSSKILKNNLIA